jgi:hypothetical protein
MRWNSYGKCWPKVTQCILYIDSGIKCHCEVVKHENDIDNPLFTRTLTAKMAFKQAKFWKELRVEFWKLMGYPTA